MSRPVMKNPSEIAATLVPVLEDAIPLHGCLAGLAKTHRMVREV